MPKRRVRNTGPLPGTPLRKVERYERQDGPSGPFLVEILSCGHTGRDVDPRKTATQRFCDRCRTDRRGPRLRGEAEADA